MAAISKEFSFIALSILLTLLTLTSACSSPTSPAVPPLPNPPDRPVIEIAVLSPTSGEMATVGRQLQNGIILAFDQWNSQGGLLGHQLQWRIYDTNCDFESGRQAAQQAIDAGHQFIIGPLCSEAAISAATVAESHRVLMIAPTATHPRVTTDGQAQTRSTVFRASYPYPWQAQATAHFAIDTLMTQKAALLYNLNDDYAVSLADTFSQEFTVLGGQIVHRATYTTGQADFTTILTALEKTNPDLIYLPAPAASVNQIAPALNSLNFSNNFTLFGSGSWHSETLDHTNTIGSYYPLHFTTKDERRQVKAWVELYKATYAVEPDTLAALGYDAAHLLATAIQQAGTFEIATVVEILEQNTFDGVTGPITFDAQHNPMKPVPIIQVEATGTALKTIVSLSSNDKDLSP